MTGLAAQRDPAPITGKLHFTDAIPLFVSESVDSPGERE